jgi:hypothetical protein
MEPKPRTGGGAYIPLGSSAGESMVEVPGIKFLDATAVGSVLVIRFRWPLDAQDRDLLLPLDFSAFDGDVIGSSVWILEYVRQHLHHDQRWFQRDVVALSPGSALVISSRQPGRA